MIIGSCVRIEPLAKLNKTAVLLEADCRIRLGEAEAARDLLSKVLAYQPDDSSLCLAMANTYAPSTGQSDVTADTARLGWINRVYEKQGLIPIGKRDPQSPLSLDNMVAAIPERGPDQLESPLVSIVVPAYNCATTIGYAVGSLRAQTLTSIEIIVVDDVSSDETRTVVSEITRNDPRVRLICLSENSGPYVARNRGVSEAKGAYLTVHDADDWSHPQKLQLQVEQLLRAEHLKANLSYWARVSRELYLLGNWRPTDTIFGKNHSSLMIKTNLIKDLGGWDVVRVGADNEFLWRLARRFGQTSVGEVFPEVPLSYSFVRNSSLTRESATHIKTFYFGIRNDYRQAYHRWHKSAARSGDFSISPLPTLTPRKFPAPAAIRSPRVGYSGFDNVFIGDFAVAGIGLDTVLSNIRQSIASGKRIGIFHWPDYRLPNNRGLDAEICCLLDQFAVEQISAFQIVETSTLTLCNPLLIGHVMDGLPKFQFQRLEVLSPTWLAQVDLLEKQAKGEIPSKERLEAFFKASPESKSANWAVLDGIYAPESLTTYSKKAIAALVERARSGDQSHSLLLARLRCDADEALNRGPYSVVDKRSPPPSGDFHDYYHVAPYWWPNPDTHDGMPYILRDGHRAPGTHLYEPESDQYDRTRLQRLFDDTTILALAWMATGELAYAEHAARLVKSWFISPKTRMNPHLRYAQVKPGRGEGSRTGIIEAKDFYFFLDAVRILRDASTLSVADHDSFAEWLREYLQWLLTSKQGREEQRAANNHGTCYDLQVASIAAYLGDLSQLLDTLRASQSRILEQFLPNGEQPHEMKRAITAHYCCFNLQSWVNLARLAERCGSDLWNQLAPDGRGLQSAFEWLLPYMAKADWPWRQEEPFDRERFIPLCFAYWDAYGDASPIGIPASPESSLVKPVFSPHDGISPFWQLGLDSHKRQCSAIEVRE